MISCSAVINKIQVDVNIIQESTQIKSCGAYNFGDVKVGDSSEFATFTIQNTGTDALHLLGIPNFVEISGTDADSFTLVQDNLRSPIFPGSEQNFDISFMPTSEGLKEATISILYNDVKRNRHTLLQSRALAPFSRKSTLNREPTI